MIVTGLYWWSDNIGSGNGLVPSGNKPLPEPRLTQFSVAMWRRHLRYFIPLIAQYELRPGDSYMRQPLQWRHNERDGVLNHLRLDCLLNRLFRRRSRKTLKLHVTGLYEGNSPVTGEIPAQMASNKFGCLAPKYIPTTNDNVLSNGQLETTFNKIECLFQEKAFENIFSKKSHFRLKYARTICIFICWRAFSIRLNSVGS